MNHPYYIVQWYEGRLPCPAHLRCTVIKREFERGGIGGKRLVEKTTTDPQEAYRLWRQNQYRNGCSVYIVKARNRQRERVRQPHTLNAPVHRRETED